MSLVYAIFYCFLSFSLSCGRRLYFQFANRPFWGKTRKNPCRMLRSVCAKDPKPTRKHCCAVWVWSSGTETREVLDVLLGDPQKSMGCDAGQLCWVALLGAEWDQRDPECLQLQSTWESAILDICNHRKKKNNCFAW